MRGQPELSTDAIIAELIALYSEELCEFEAMRVKRGNRLSEDLNAVKLGMALGVRHAILRIDELHGRPGRRKWDGDV
jgi:hypothetical protein